MDNDFDLWEVLVSTFWFMLLVAWFWMIISILTDLFRDREMRGVAKALWALFIVLVPWLGVLVYIIVRGDAMNQRQRAMEHHAGMRSSNGSASGAGLSGELRELAELRDSGVLSPTEYEHAKAKALA